MMAAMANVLIRHHRCSFHLGLRPGLIWCATELCVSVLPLPSVRTDRLQICNVNTQFFVDPFDTTLSNPGLNQGALSFSLALVNDVINLRKPGSDIDNGSVNLGSCEGLRAILPMPHTSLEALLFLADVDEYNTKRDRRSQTTKMPIEVNVFGLRADGASVGSILAHHGLFLQAPRLLNERVAYCNPHWYPSQEDPDAIPIDAHVEATSSERAPVAVPEEDLETLIETEAFCVYQTAPEDPSIIKSKLHMSVQSSCSALIIADLKQPPETSAQLHV